MRYSAINTNNLKKICFSFTLLGLVTVPFGVLADTASDIAAKKAADQARLEELQAQIKQYNQEIATRRNQAASLSNEIALYDTQIKSTQLQIEATQTNIGNTQSQIDETKAQIKLKTAQIAEEKVLLSQLIVTLQEYDNTSGLQMSLGSDKFSDFMDQVQYTESIQSKVYSLLQQIKDIKAKLEADEESLQKNLDQLNQLNEQLGQTQATLNEQKSGKVQLLSVTRGQQSRYQKLLTSSQDEEAKIRQEMLDLDRQAGVGKTYNKLPVVHGVLAWPMDGVLTQAYGNTGFTSLGYTFHNGLDIAAPAGTPIYAPADGVVNGVGTGQTAYGNWVSVYHKAGGKLDRDIVTLYGHMRKFVVSKGQAVKKGDLIGYEGNTGNTSRLLYGPDRGYHLHFTVFDANGFGIKDGAYPKVYGPYQVPYGHPYDPRLFL